jgi:uncharacterized protein (TIGR02145 family)
MKFKIHMLLSVLLMLGSINTFAQIGIGTTTPAPSAALEVSPIGNNKGVLIPRLTATQKDAIASPAEGLLVYQTTAPIGFYFYTNTVWKLIVTQTDLDTKVNKVTGKELSTNDYTTSEKTKLAAISGTNTGDQDLSALATVASVALKANATDLTNSLALKVDKETGKDLSSNDFTTTEKTKLAAITGTNTGDQDLSALATTASVALKANTSDVNTNLALKANNADVALSLNTKVDKVAGKDLSSTDYTAAEKTKLAAITGTNTGDQDLSALATIASVALKANTSDVNTNLALKANNADVALSLNTKVDKVAGKELSSNDYTTLEKTKLAAIIGSNTGDQDLSALATTASVALKANTSDVNTNLALKANNADVTNSLALKANITDVNTALALKAPLVSPTLVTPNIGLATGTSLSVSGQLTSTIVTGTAPLVVSSTTPVANLSIGGNAATATLASTVTTNANLTGDVTSSGSNVTTVTQINGTALSGLATGILKNTTTTGVPSIAVASDFPTLNQNTTGTADNVTGTVAISNGGTGLSTTPANGQIDIGNGTGFTRATLTQGTGISITNTGGAITIASSSPLPLPTSNTTGDMLYWDSNAWVKVAAGSNGQILTFVGNTPVWQKPVIAIAFLGLSDVYNPKTGKIWMDRNLGATQVATSSTDAASYGDLYQWGRGADGHQIRTSATTATLSGTDVPGNGNFITLSFDWRSSQNDNLWQVVSGNVNNPCPSGYRLPTETEWEQERLSWTSSNAAGAFDSPLKLTLAGSRSSSGSLQSVGTDAYYWSSTVRTISSDLSLSRYLNFASGYGSIYNRTRSTGHSVRCIKN